MFKYWQKIDELHHHNRLLLVLIGILLVFIFGLLMLLLTYPKRVEFWLTPSMSANGGLIRPNQVTNEYVHGFVATLFPTLNTWGEDGNTTFANQLQAFQYYFSPRHQALMQSTFTAYEKAHLFERTQTASLYRFMEPDDIKLLGHGAWEVHLLLRITQRLHDSSTMVIADKVVDYHLRVVKLNLSKLQNPFELALDGYTQPEHLVKDLLSGEQPS